MRDSSARDQFHIVIMIQPVLKGCNYGQVDDPQNRLGTSCNTHLLHI
jgi:hypothetical protein